METTASGSGTTFSHGMGTAIKNLVKKKDYSVIIFTDSDILAKENLDPLIDAVAAAWMAKKNAMAVVLSNMGEVDKLVRAMYAVAKSDPIRAQGLQYLLNKVKNCVYYYSADRDNEK